MIILLTARQRTSDWQPVKLCTMVLSTLWVHLICRSPYSSGGSFYHLACAVQSTRIPRLDHSKSTVLVQQCKSETFRSPGSKQNNATVGHLLMYSPLNRHEICGRPETTADQRKVSS